MSLDGGGEPDAAAHSVSAHSETRVRRDNSEPKLITLARLLSRKIKIGQKKREDLEAKGRWVDSEGTAQTIHQCFQQTIDKGFDLDQIERALATEVQKTDVKRRAWTAWFVLSCLQLIRDKRRTGRKCLPARGARLANLIVNRLLLSDGVAAMGVYDALAGKDHQSYSNFIYIADGIQSNIINYVRLPSALLKTLNISVSWLPRNYMVRSMRLSTIPGCQFLWPY